MTKRSKILRRRLDAIESKFAPLLFSCLRTCAEGRWGLLGQNDHFVEAQWLYWPAAEKLRALALEIRSIRAEVGGQNEMCERFLALCPLRGANVPGEPRLAAIFLADWSDQIIDK